VKGRVAHLEGQVAHLKGHVVHLKGHVVHLKGHVAHLKGHVAHLKGHVAHLKGHVAHLKGHVAARDPLNQCTLTKRPARGFNRAPRPFSRVASPESLQVTRRDASARSSTLSNRAGSTWKFATVTSRGSRAMRVPSSAA
jgi:hypothetical protein